MAKYDVVAIGEINADLVLSGDVTPVFGQVEKLIDGASLVIGSSAAIFACGAARLGLRTAIIGKVGADFFGRFMRDALVQKGVDVSGVVVDPDLPTGLSVILARGADRAILTHKGSMAALTYDEIDPSIVGAARHLHLASYYLLDGLRHEIVRLFDQAHAAGATVSLDTNYDPAETWDGGVRLALRHADVFLPNTTEAMGITGASSPAAALSRLAEWTPLVAIKRGADGASAVRGGMGTIDVAAPRVEVIDTVGAGDSFDAGFVYGFLNGWEIERILALAAATGSLSTRKPGGTDGQPDLGEALAFVERNGVIAR